MLSNAEISAHTDYGTVTVLRGDDVPGGLQVKIRSGEWVDVHPPKGALTCNIGDLMMRWTNDRWFSNLHEKGNTGSASIFIILDELFRSGRLRKGDRLLLFVPESGRFSMCYALLTAA